ncbi:MAG: nuclear transport factor 2 family protein [Myxococcota bacterium]
MDQALSERNQTLIDRYFEMMTAGDPELASLLAEDVRWCAPQSSPVGALHEGKPAVLELMGSGIGLYDPSVPMEIERTATAASDEKVFVEMTITGRSKGGAPYRNHYVMVFQVRDGLIVEVHEHLDTLYAQKVLFDPVGWASPLD